MNVALITDSPVIKIKRNLRCGELRWGIQNKNFKLMYRLVLHPLLFLSKALNVVVGFGF